MHYATLGHLECTGGPLKAVGGEATNTLEITVGPGPWFGLEPADAATCRNTDVFVCIEAVASPAARAWLDATRAFAAPATIASGPPGQVIAALQDLAGYFNGHGVFEDLEFDRVIEALGCGSDVPGCRIAAITSQAPADHCAAGLQLLASMVSAEPTACGAGLCIVAGSQATLRLEHVRGIARGLTHAHANIFFVPVWDASLDGHLRISLVMSNLPASLGG